MTLPYPGARPNNGGGDRPVTGGGNRPTTANPGKAPAGHRQGPVGLGTTFHYRFFITYRLTEPVVYEYRGGSEFSPTLVYLQKHRNFYRVKDLIFFTNVSQKWLRRIYPTLARKEGSKTFLENLIDSEILGPEPSYVVAQRIESITPVIGKPGYGVVRTKPVIFFGKTAVYLSDERGNHYSVMDLTSTLAEVQLSASLNSMLPMIYFTAEVLMMVLGGAAKAAVSRSMSVYVARKGAIKLAGGVARDQAEKLLLKAMIKNGAEASAKATLEFVREFLKKAGESKVEEALRAQADARQKVEYGVLGNAIKDASIAFAIKFVDECMGSLVGSMARQAGVDKTVKEYIGKKLVSLVTTEPAGVFIGAYRKSVLEKDRKLQGNKLAAQQDLYNELKDWFWKYLKGLLKDSVGVATS